MAERAVVITGSAGGIGQALVRAFQENNTYVVGLDKSPESSSDAFVSADLGRFVDDELEGSAVTQKLLKAVGERPLFALINNAAVQVLGSISELDRAAWHRSFAVNTIAPALLAQGLLSRLQASGGSVLNIGSIHRRLTKRGFAAYSTSKAALDGLTRAMALDLAPTVRVNAIDPAATATTMLEAGFEGKERARDALDAAHPLERIAQPAEVAALAVFLAGDQARFIHGAHIGIDGGVSARLFDPAED